jgi:uncharacterized OB-fold protein
MSEELTSLGPVVPPVTAGTQGWWDATREQRLTVQRCGACGHAQLYPRVLCIACHGTDLWLEDAAGVGEVLSFSVVHRSPDPERYRPPYTVGLVRLAEGPVMTAVLVARDPDDWRCDMPVRVVWEPLGDGRYIPLFISNDTEDDGGRPWTSR